MKRRIATIFFIVIILPSVCFGLDIASQFPSFTSKLVVKSDPLIVIFYESLNLNSVEDNSFFITINGQTEHVPGAIAFQSTNTTNDTAVFTPTDTWQWGIRYKLHVTGDVQDVNGNPFSGEPPYHGIFVVNIPNDLEIPVYNPGDPFAMMVRSAVLMGFNPMNPEADAPPWDIPGANVTGAWKYSVGRPEVIVAIIDNGIDDYDDPELRRAFFLNQGELPLPNVNGVPCSQYDCNGDGRFDVDDYEFDNRLSGSGPPTVRKLLDAFSNGIDEDGNGLIDDISGWDFVRNVNEVIGVSDFPSGTHGAGMMGDSVNEANNGIGSLPGACPECRAIIIRASATLIYDFNIVSAGVRYASSMGAKAINFSGVNYVWSAKAHEAITEAFESGTLMAAVSGDEMSFHHWFPSAGEDVLDIKSLIPMVAIDFGGGINTDYVAFIESYCTNFGSHIHFAVPSTYYCSSDATGLTTGMLGLINSYALERGINISPDEVKQLLFLSSYDIKDRCFSIPDFFNVCKEGYDEHFGYGRPDLGVALAALGDPDFGMQAAIPPSVLITEPKWWQTFDPVASPNMEVRGHISSRTTPFNWKVQVAEGVEPWEAQFVTVASGASSEPIDGLIATVPINELFPESWASGPPSNAYSFDITLRIQASYESEAKEIIGGEARKTISVHSDNDPKTGLVAGFPKNLGASGESSPLLYDLDGDADGRLEIVLGTGDGKVVALKYDDTKGSWDDMPGFPVDCSGGDPWIADSFFASLAIGDLFGDGKPEIVGVTMRGKVYAIDPAKASQGNPFLEGFPVSTDTPDNSSPLAFGYGTGFLGSPVLADLDQDGILEIVAANIDQKVYAWKPVVGKNSEAQRLPGWPVLARSAEGMVPEDKVCQGNHIPAQILATPAVGILDPNNPDLHISQFPSVVVSTGEVCDSDFLSQNRVYAIYHDGMNHEGGPFLPGWPAKPVSPLGDSINLDIAVGSNASPTVLVTDQGAIITIGSVGWFPQYIRYSNNQIIIAEIPIILSVGCIGSTSISSLKGDDQLQFIMPVVSALRLGDNGLQLINPRIIAMDVQSPHGQILQAEIEDIPFLVNPSVADLDNNGEREVIAGSGGYLVHAYSLGGGEAPDWPKYTQKWTMNTPAVADIDADGKLEIVSHTREGYLYAWESEGSACPNHKPNSDWRRYHHDERNTGFYGADTIPPFRVTDLSAQELTNDKIRMTFTATGDDWNCGKASSYDIRYSTEDSADLSDPAQFAGAAVIQYPPSPSGFAGETESFAILAPGARHVAIQVRDKAGNASRISNDAVVTPPADDDTSDDDAGDDDSGSDEDDDSMTDDDSLIDDDASGGDDDATDDDSGEGHAHSKHNESNKNIGGCGC